MPRGIIKRGEGEKGARLWEALFNACVKIVSDNVTGG